MNKQITNLRNVRINAAFSIIHKKKQTSAVTAVKDKKTAMTQPAKKELLERIQNKSSKAHLS